jgi:hypothetical protein
VQLPLDLPMRPPIGTVQEDLGAENQTLGQCAFAHHGLQFLSISLTQS